MNQVTVELPGVDPSNVEKLGPAWVFETGTRRGLEATPIVVDETGAVTPYARIDVRSLSMGPSPGDAESRRPVGIELHEYYHQGAIVDNADCIEHQKSAQCFLVDTGEPTDQRGIRAIQLLPRGRVRLDGGRFPGGHGDDHGADGRGRDHDAGRAVRRSDEPRHKARREGQIPLSKPKRNRLNRR